MFVKNSYTTALSRGSTYVFAVWLLRRLLWGRRSDSLYGVTSHPQQADMKISAMMMNDITVAVTKNAPPSDRKVDTTTLFKEAKTYRHKSHKGSCRPMYLRMWRS
jgi:hypothetical protein